MTDCTVISSHQQQWQLLCQQKGAYSPKQLAMFCRWLEQQQWQLESLGLMPLNPQHSLGQISLQLRLPSHAKNLSPEALTRMIKDALQ